jgi:hypothetical protein
MNRIMKLTKIFLLLFILNIGVTYGQIDSLTSKLLDSIKVDDQKWRNLSHKVAIGEIDTITIDQIKIRVKEVDSLNYLIINDLFNRYGYLGYNKVGVLSSHYFWLLVQHSDKHPDFQERVLDSMKIEASKGNSSMKDYAYLLDRVKVNARKLQIYGTQMQYDSINSTYEPKPVEEPANLNMRRKEVGLSTIEDYIRIMNENYKPDEK